MMDIEQSVARYLHDSGHSFVNLKAVLFDMDGVNRLGSGNPSLGAYQWLPTD